MPKLNIPECRHASTARDAARCSGHDPKERTMKRLPLLLTALLLSGAALAQSATPAPSEGGHERMREHMRERAEHKFGEADSNHDGNISQSEWQSARLREANAAFQKYDANRDGKISRAEMDQAREQHMGARGGRGGHGERMKALDTDGDQQLSRAELGDRMPRLAADFDRLDGNHDGKLSREEMRAGKRGWHGGEDDRDVDAGQAR
jgi:Ca2+-binding EF-hand superfamily protein